MSVEEYRQEMELYMRKTFIMKEENTLIYRFLSGLSLEIRDKVELLPYMDLTDFVQLFIKVEQQNLRKGFVKRVLTLTLIPRKSIKESTKGMRVILEIKRK